MTGTEAVPSRPSIFVGKTLAWVVAVPCVLLDQWSKAKVFSYLASTGVDREEILRGSIVRLNLVAEYNTGMAFGLMQNIEGSHVILAVVRAMAVLALLWLLRVTPHRARLQQVSVAVLLAGAIGNLADNLFQSAVGHEHAVRDFIHVAVSNWSLPAFNFADACVTIGFLMLLRIALRSRRRTTQQTET